MTNLRKLSESTGDRHFRKNGSYNTNLNLFVSKNTKLYKILNRSMFRLVLIVLRNEKKTMFRTIPNVMSRIMFYRESNYS